MSNRLLTVGHSTHSIEYFLGLLKKHAVEVIVDVRSVPYSRRNPQFNRESLQQQLRLVGIKYVFLGKELGARSENPACYNEGKVQYDCLAREPLFLEGIRRLRTGVQDYRVSLMCAERDPLTCHRTILVCRELRGLDLDVDHILADGTTESHHAAEQRLISLMNIRPDMFHSELDCIERAYVMQADHIAYTIEPQDAAPHSRDARDEDLHNRLHQ